jgi:2-iminobutanoate/2-iminopropanoate deaminase
MTKEVIAPKGAQVPAAPISQAVRSGDFIFVSGQVAEDLRTGEPIQGPIAVQARQVLNNLATVLESAGASMNDVVKVTAFLTDIDDFENFNEVYRTFFPTDPPARSTFQVVRLAGPFIVEIEAIAATSK